MEERLNCNIGNHILQSKDGKNTIYFLGAKQLENNKWLVNFGFERVNYKYKYEVDWNYYTCPNEGYGYGYGWGYGYGSSDIISLEVTLGEKIYFASYFGLIKENKYYKEVKRGILHRRFERVEQIGEEFYINKGLTINEIKSSYLDYTLDLELIED